MLRLVGAAPERRPLASTLELRAEMNVAAGMEEVEVAEEEEEATVKIGMFCDLV